MTELKIHLGPTIIKALLKLGGSANTIELRDEMGFVRSYNFAANLTDLFTRNLLQKRKNLHAEGGPRGGRGNIWTVSKKGKDYLNNNTDQILSYREVEAELKKRFFAAEERKSNAPPRSRILPKVSKGVGAAMDSIALLIEENQKRDALLRSIRSMIDAVLEDPDEESELES